MRVPNIVRAARVLHKHRGRSSYGFLLRWTVWHRMRQGAEDILPEAILHSMGVHNPQLDKIAGIYNGLQREKGTLKAAQVCLEIVQELEKNGTPAR